MKDPFIVQQVIRRYMGLVKKEDLMSGGPDRPDQTTGQNVNATTTSG